MRPIGYLGLVALLALSACATPQEQCINAATREVAIMDQLIAETRRNIDRGYAIEERQIVVPQFQRCERIVTGADGKPTTDSYFCMKDTVQTVRDPKAIDLEVETRKLDSMLARRARMATEAARVVESCRARYPK